MGLFTRLGNSNLAPTWKAQSEGEDSFILNPRMAPMGATFSSLVVFIGAVRTGYKGLTLLQLLFIAFVVSKGRAK